jgi:hypothetical protein
VALQLGTYEKWESAATCRLSEAEKIVQNDEKSWLLKAFLRLCYWATRLNIAER